MSKKNQAEVSTKQLEKEAVQHEKLRQETIKQFNLNNANSMWIDPNKVPTEEDIAQAKKDFEERTKALNEKTFIVADKTEAERVVKFLIEFIKNATWQKRTWVGVLNYVAEAEDFLKEYLEEAKDYVLPYAPIQFLYLMLDNYQGTGYDEAVKMSKIWDEYIPIHDSLGDIIAWYNNEAEECQKLQQRWASMEQGYYLVILPPVEPDVTDKEAEAAVTTENGAVSEQ